VPEVVQTAGREELEVSIAIEQSQSLPQLLKDKGFEKNQKKGSEPRQVQTACLLRLAHAQVVFLGTGAAIPAKYRNVTGIYVHLFARGGLMLDCGAH
jgi:hypothetical protein